MREILCAEQPCILCGQLLDIVTIHRDDDTNEERIHRERVEHSQQDCLTFAKLYSETWPCHAPSLSSTPQANPLKGTDLRVARSGDSYLRF